MKKAIAGAGVVLGGVAALLAMQAPAQAAAPSVTATAAQSAEPKADMKPMWIGSVAKAAVVHGKALAGTQAIRSQVGNVVRIASLGSAPADTTSTGAPSVEEVFDK